MSPTVNRKCALTFFSEEKAVRNYFHLPSPSTMVM